MKFFPVLNPNYCVGTCSYHSSTFVHDVHGVNNPIGLCFNTLKTCLRLHSWRVVWAWWPKKQEIAWSLYPGVWSLYLGGTLSRMTHDGSGILSACVGDNLDCVWWTVECVLHSFPSHEVGKKWPPSENWAKLMTAEQVKMQMESDKTKFTYQHGLEEGLKTFLDHFPVLVGQVKGQWLLVLSQVVKISWWY